jgi:hypothetical protein
MGELAVSYRPEVDKIIGEGGQYEKRDGVVNVEADSGIVGQMVVEV